MMRLITRSIGAKILAALMAIYVVTYVATALVVYSGIRNGLMEAGTGALNQLADLKYERLATRIDALADNLTAWSQLEVMNDLVSGDVDKRVTAALEGLKRLYDLPGDIYAFDTAGTLIASSSPHPLPAVKPPTAPTPGGLRSLPPEWRVEGRAPTFLDKHRDPISGGWTVALAIPILGTFAPDFRLGTLVVTLPWPALETLLYGLDTGTVLLRLGPGVDVLSASPAALARQAGLDSANPPTGANAYIIGRSVTHDGLLRAWQVVVAQDVPTVTRPLRHVALDLVLLGLCLGLPIVISVRWLARRLTAPVSDLTRVVREIADTDRLDIRVPVSSEDELGFLAQSFNRMTETLQRAMAELEGMNQSLEGKVAARTTELEAAIAAQRRLIRDISHEVKSPLARLSMALGLARRVADAHAPLQFDRMEREIATIASLATELLTLAKLEGADSAVAVGPVDLASLIADVIDDALFEVPERAGDVHFNPDGQPAILDGNADLLRRAVENVVRNALFYTSPGVPVAVALERLDHPAGAGTGGLRITVADQGPGVPDDAMDQLFEPFYRVDQARARATGGSGIGLTICKRVMELHRGGIRARHNHPHGLVVEMDLPLGHDADGNPDIQR
ncbi:sensor histidine kinase [Nitrospirillum iridis]|uniref:histidine kinase n=1 Tax=Nitrospirillum iridis TaxID=765888 RepID=A0A7X0AWW0_9PROT|nr:ATP-binding protein [Nitrospirillum iridis]MBB6251207.1 signal transduction histidine kinase [Nitrospirillum iridis]